MAAAALANSPSPGVGERPLVLRTYEKEALAALKEIRSRLKISEYTDPETAHSLIAKTIADTLRQAILGHADTEAILKRMGNSGRLPSASYNVLQSQEFQTAFYRLGIRGNHVEDAVKHPDDLQHLMTEGMPESWHDISLFMKYVASRELSRRHWLLVQAHRVATDQRVGAAWRIYPEDINLETAQQPIDVLKAFVEAYGVPISIDGTKVLFIEFRSYPVNVSIKIDWTGAPEDHFVSIAHTTDLSGRFRIGLTYCIDIPKYSATLKARGVKVEEVARGPGRTITQTTTAYPREFTPT